MADVYADRVKETSTTTGTGTYSLDGAATGYQTFVAGVGTGNTCVYVAEDGTDWEVGQGTVTDATPDTLARTTIYASSNAGAAVNWTAGTRNISLTWSAQAATELYSGGRVELDSITDPVSGEFDFSSIPSGYNRLIIEGYIASDAAAANDAVYVFINADTTVANYLSQRNATYNNTAQSFELSTPSVAVTVGSTGYNTYSYIYCVIENYTGSDKKQIVSTYTLRDTSASMGVGQIAVGSEITAAVTRLRFRTDNYSTDSLIGTLRLYGEF